jgi:hypothetical protein
VAVKDGAARTAQSVAMLLQARRHAKFVGKRVAAKAMCVAAARSRLG